MGGSMALGLKGHCLEVLGLDVDPEVAVQAKAQNVVARASIHPAESLPLADVIVLALPVGVILEMIPRLAELCTKPVVVLDLGSTKGEIVAAFAQLPAHIQAIGGHPMAGKSVLGLANAQADLYQHASFMLAPAAHCDEQAVQLATELVQTLGAVPLFLDPQEHDRWVGGTSHLPYILSSALAQTLPLEVAAMIGTGFISTSRLAQTPSSMMLDVLLTNRENILEMAENFKQEFQAFTEALEAGNREGLQQLLDEAARQRARLLQAAEEAKQ